MDLAPLLRPRSVAVVGATDRPDSYAGNVLTNLERAGYRGEVYGVNPKRTEVHGRPCFPTVSDLPEPVDAVVVAIPAAGVPAVVAEAAERGCRGAVVLSAGFAEVEGGIELQRQLRDAALEAGLPLCGPNGNGVLSVDGGAPLWGDSAPPLEPGPVAMVSQSGNFAVNAIGSRRGIGFHTIVSTGNQAVLEASDWLAALAREEGVRSAALFLEDDGDGARLANALATCADRGVGVAVLKVGSSEEGAQAASAHTGALAGDQRVFRALIEEAGGAWAETPHELLELAKAMAEPRARPSGDGGLAVLTCSGGDSGMAADEAQRLGVALPALAEDTCDRLRELLPEAATIGNPLDYTAMIWGHQELLRQIVLAVGADPAIDQLLLMYDHPAGLALASDASWDRVRAGLAAGGVEADAGSLIASTLPDLLQDDAARELAAGGIPAIAGLRTALLCARALRRPAGDAGRLREIAAAARAARAARAPAADGWLGEGEAKRVLAEAGIGVPEGRVVGGAEECVAAAGELGFPVALKLTGPHLHHKTDVGAIFLGLGGERDLRDAFAKLSRLPAAEGAGVLVERMVEPGVELLVAARTDAVVPALVVGLGGVFTEALDDVAIVPLPADEGRVLQALRSLRRGDGLVREGVDLAAVAEAAVRVSDLVLEHGFDLVELNPVVAHAEGCVAVDAVAHRA